MKTLTFSLFFLLGFFSLSVFAEETDQVDQALRLYEEDMQKIQQEAQSALEKSLNKVEEFLNSPEGHATPHESFFGFKEQKPERQDQPSGLSLKAGKSCTRCRVHSRGSLGRDGSVEKSVPLTEFPSKPAEKQGKKKSLNFSEPSTQVIVFVSLGMSEASLKAFAREAVTQGIRLVIRGLWEGSFPQTLKCLQELQIALEIDPPLFDQFKVERVPTFVRCKLHQGQPVVQGHDRILGNIPLPTALELFKKKGTLS